MVCPTSDAGRLGTRQVAASSPGVSLALQSAYSTHPLIVAEGTAATPASSSPETPPSSTLTPPSPTAGAPPPFPCDGTIGVGHGGRSSAVTTASEPTSATQDALAKPNGVVTSCVCVSFATLEWGAPLEPEQPVTP